MGPRGDRATILAGAAPMSDTDPNRLAPMGFDLPAFWILLALFLVVVLLLLLAPEVLVQVAIVLSLAIIALLAVLAG
jgi:uncharacterized membrane protein